MPRKRSNLSCPKCGSIGGLLTKRWVKKTNNIPKFEDVTTIVQAWDYAATVCLRMHAAKLKFPPGIEIDKSLSKALYKEFTKICHHRTEEVIAFESRHMHRLLSEKENRGIHSRKIKPTSIHDNIIKLSSSEDQQYYWQDYDPYKKKIHIPLPPNTGNITNSSIAWLYGALVFKLLSYIYMFFTFSEYENRLYSYVIYSVFNLYSSFYDDRHRKTFSDWIKIYEDAKKHGISAASSLNPSYSLKGEKVQLSTKHIRNKLGNIEDQMLDLIFSAPLYKRWINRISNTTRTNLYMKEVFHIIFDRLEEELNEVKLDSKYEYYFIKHSTKHNIKWCAISKIDLANVSVIDERYKSYETLINKIVDVLTGADSNSSLQDATMQNYVSHAANILQQLGFRKDFVYDKIKSNLIMKGLDINAMSDFENYMDLTGNSRCSPFDLH